MTQDHAASAAESGFWYWTYWRGRTGWRLRGPETLEQVQAAIDASCNGGACFMGTWDSLQGAALARAQTIVRKLVDVIASEFERLDEVLPDDYALSPTPEALAEIVEAKRFLDQNWQ